MTDFRAGNPEQSSKLAEEDLPSALRLAVTRTARRLRQEAGGGLGPSCTAALATIERRGPLTPSELAEAEGIRRPTATRAIARLEEDGLIERTPDPEDGRSSILVVSAQGRAHLRRLRKRKNAYLAKRLRALDPSELETLAAAAAILDRLNDGERS